MIRCEADTPTLKHKEKEDPDDGASSSHSLCIVYRFKSLGLCIELISSFIVKKKFTC